MSGSLFVKFISEVGCMSALFVSVTFNFPLFFTFLDYSSLAMISVCFL